MKTPEEKREYARNWQRKKNKTPERKAYMKEYNKKYKPKDPIKRRISQNLSSKKYSISSRGREKAVINSIKSGKNNFQIYREIIFDFLIKRDGYICGICKGSLVDSEIHINHRHPIALGGSHTTDNVELAHASCNMSQSTDIRLEKKRMREQNGG